MALWSLDDWEYLERQVVTDPKGRQWSVALMDVLGQKGDPDRPDAIAELEYASGRYFTLIYAGGGGMQWERGYYTAGGRVWVLDLEPAAGKKKRLPQTA